MSNLTDALIAAKLVGGSGGSGGGSGLPEIKTEAVTILPEQSITFSATGSHASGRKYRANISGQFPIAEGTTITTIWDGVSYDCAVNDFQGVLAWGNLSIVGQGADTGEPFVITDSNGSGIVIVTKSTEASHTVGLTTTATNYPDGSILIAINGEWQKAEGYGYEVEGGEVVPFDRKFIPLENVSFNIATTSSTTISANATNVIFEDLSVPELDAFPPNTLFPVVYCELTYNTTEVYGVIPVKGRYMNGQLSISCYNFTSSDVTISTGTVVSLALLIPHKIELD